MDPSVLEAQSKSEAVVQLTVALRESNVPHLRWSQAPPCLGQGEAGSADIYTKWGRDPQFPDSMSKNIFVDLYNYCSI